MTTCGSGITLFLLCLAPWITIVSCHGRLLEPPNRASLWRFGYNVEPNYNDNGLNCGGYRVQWLRNRGRCGHCGDPFLGRREHEMGGTYFNDVIPRTYKSGDVINITVEITANHGGYFRFYMCHKPYLSESCFMEHPLEVVGEGPRHKLRHLKSPFNEELQLQLPAGISCSHCVLQWRWNCGQNYGVDRKSGRFCKGCGPQEQFWNCADIAIEESPKAFHRSHHPPGHHDEDEAKSNRRLSAERSPLVARKVGCWGAPKFGSKLDSWCRSHCSIGFCPTTHCMCI